MTDFAAMIGYFAYELLMFFEIYIYIYIYCKLGSVSQNQTRCKLLQLWGHKKTVNEHFKQCEITSELFTPYWCEIACSCGNTNSMPIYIVRAKLHVICFFYTTWVWNCLLLRGHQLIAKSHYICVDKKCRNWINKNVGMNTKIITNKYIVEDK